MTKKPNAGETTMGNVIYEAYRRNRNRNLNLREQVERKARETRAKEIDRLIVAPLLRGLRRTFSRGRQRLPIASIALRACGLIGVVILGGLLVACGSSVPDAGAAVAAPTRARTKPVAERHFIFERLDHSVVNQHSTAHESDLPGASIAAYGDSVVTYQQAHALAEQGKQQEAVVLVQTRATEAMDAIAAKAKENKGSIAAFWDAVKGAGGKAWQGMADLGKDETPEAKLTQLQQTLADRQARGALNDSTGVTASYAKGIANLEAEISKLQESITANQAAAKAQGDADQINERATTGIPQHGSSLSGSITRW